MMRHTSDQPADPQSGFQGKKKMLTNRLRSETSIVSLIVLEFSVNVFWKNLNQLQNKLDQKVEK